MEALEGELFGLTQLLQSPHACFYLCESPAFVDLHIQTHIYNTRTNCLQIPLILSGIFYASNTSTHISYIDSLFINVSAMTVTGLATVNLSTLTGWQQAIIFIQMLIGSTVSCRLTIAARH